MSQWIRVHWWPSCNYGDALSPFIVERLSGKKAVWTDLGSKVDKVLTTGTIIVGHLPNCVVWGSGTMHEDGTPGKADYRAVRGPLTRRLILKAGYSCPEIYGDPAILMPILFRPSIHKNYRLGIIPHYVDAEKVVGQYSGEDVLIVMPTNPIEKVISEILSCEAVVSSSLHGLITACAYGIPCLWVEFTDGVAGKGFKFRDFFASSGIEPYKPYDLRGKGDIKDIYARTSIHRNNSDIRSLLGSCPFLGDNQ